MLLKVLIYNLWSFFLTLPRLLSSLRRIIDVISTMRHVTTQYCGWEGADVSVYCHVDTSNSSPHPTTNIHLPVTESTAMHYYNGNVILLSYQFCQQEKGKGRFWKIKFNFLLTFCLYFVNGWPIQVSPLWSCPFHISQFDFWNYHWKFVLYCQTENIKFPLWSHNSVSQAVKYY